MNITVLAVGTKMPRWVDEAVAEYAKRFGRDVHYALKEIKPEKRGAGVNAAQGMAAEEKRLLEAIPPGAFWWCLMSAAKRPPRWSWPAICNAGSKRANTFALSSAVPPA